MNGTNKATGQLFTLSRPNPMQCHGFPGWLKLQQIKPKVLSTRAFSRLMQIRATWMDGTIQMLTKQRQSTLHDTFRIKATIWSCGQISPRLHPLGGWKRRSGSRRDGEPPPERETGHYRTVGACVFVFLRFGVTAACTPRRRLAGRCTGKQSYQHLFTLTTRTWT